jgi:methylase of polypeptide subunit release factors
LWEEIQIQKAKEETEEAFRIGDRDLREKRLKEISDVFESNKKNYGRKLFLIENCIFGIDIQPIAIQISKLRFFISLIVDQQTGGSKENNYNVLPLPNLETKFVAANTLIGVKREQGVLADPEIEKKQQELLVLRHKHFNARKADEKIVLREQDEALSQYLADLLKKDGFYNSADAQKMANWNPYDQTNPSDFFDTYWMFGVEDGFDVVIGNPPYVESRSADVPEEMKEKYLNQVFFDFSKYSEYITKGSDLLIYFFPRSIFLLSNNGIGTLIVQNGWLNTDYGAKATQFFVNTLEYMRVSDSPFRHFDPHSANINTVVTIFKKKSTSKSICFDMMRTVDQKIVTENEKVINIDNDILTSFRWGTIMYTNNDIFDVLKKIADEGKKFDQSFYAIGQGINESKATFIPISERDFFLEDKNIINAIYKEYKYIYSSYDYFLYHSFIKNKKDIDCLGQINSIELFKGKIFKRKYPSIIMPRGIGATHFAGLLSKKTLSNSFVDIYMLDDDEERKLNIWLFCNSSLFFLYREISGRKNLGGGLLKSEASDIKSLPLYFPISEKKTILSILKRMGIPSNLKERLKTDVQKEIDYLVFSYFGIDDRQELIISELLRLFDFRAEKAKS